MLVNESSLLVNFVNIIVLIYFTSLLIPTGQGKVVEIEVHDPKVDVALLYDQSSSMDSYVNHSIWGYMSEWIRNYFKGSDANQTQFAVLGCKEGKEGEPDHESLKPVLYLNGNHQEGTITSKLDKAQMVIDAQNFVQTYGGDNNPTGCLEATGKKIFQKEMGDRDDAQNVVLYVTDCVIFNEGGSTLYTEKQIVDRLGRDTAFLFICVQNWLQPVWLKDINWYIFKDREGLVQRLNEMLEKKKKIKVTHCKTSGKNETGCVHQSNGLCFNFMYPIIIDFPDPPQHANHTGCKNETIKCDPAKCLTKASTSTTDVRGGTESGGKGTVGKGTAGTETVGTESVGKATVGTGTGGTVTDGIETRGTGLDGTNHSEANRVSLESMNSTPMIIGVVIGVVLLLIVFVVIVVVVLSRRKRKTAPKAKGKVASLEKRASEKDQGKGESLEAKRASVKDKGMKVDICEDSTMTKGGKSKAGKSMANKKADKSTVSGKGVKSIVTKKAESSKDGKPKSTPKSSEKSVKK